MTMILPEFEIINEMNSSVRPCHRVSEISIQKKLRKNPIRNGNESRGREARWRLFRDTSKQSPLSSPPVATSAVERS